MEPELALPPPKPFDRLKIWLKKHPRRTLLLGLALLVLLVIGGWLVFRPHQTPAVNPTIDQPAAVDTRVPSPLTGVKVKKQLAEQRVIGVMIENLAGPGAARPQSGLSQAGIVFETVAEGGITRYLALFQETRPKVLGPVRSLRPYYLDWVTAFDAPFAHAGGSADALSLVALRHAPSLNGLVYSQYFYRAGDRAAPHNLYTSGAKLNALANSRGFAKHSEFTSYARVEAETPDPTPNHKNLRFDFSGPDYAVRYQYRPKQNDYARFLAGVADKDRNSGKQITVKNVVWVDIALHYEFKNGHTYSVLKDIGSGKAVVFRDGTAIACTWKKSAPSSPLKLLDAHGNDIKLDPGSTWFEAVPHGNQVKY